MKAAAVLLAALLWLSMPVSGAESWKIQFFHDEDDSRLTIHDLRFPSPERGIAVGALHKKDESRPTALVTSDGGANWSFVPLKEIGLSLFFLNDSLGWMVTDEGIWRTEESGRSWRKLKKMEGLRRVYFVTESRGWATGERKAIYETGDGGREWRKLPAAEEPKTTPEYTTYDWIEFAGPLGAITGWSQPPRRDDSRLPAWMDPERARHRFWPSLTVLLQTPDGGKSWKAATSSVFGRITKMRLLGSGVGLSLVEFGDGFEWPCEVYRIDLAKGETARVFRRKDRAITDVALLSASSAYLAGYEAPGVLHGTPIPGKLKILHSNDLAHWEESEVDYRAFASRAIFASADADHVWVATDTGMILKLGRE